MRCRRQHRSRKDTCSAVQPAASNHLAILARRFEFDRAAIPRADAPRHQRLCHNDELEGGVGGGPFEEELNSPAAANPPTAAAPAPVIPSTTTERNSGIDIPNGSPAIACLLPGAASATASPVSETFQLTVSPSLSR